MKRQMIAALSATALVLSGFVAQPASAKGKNDVLKLLLGAAAVGLLLNQMNGNQADANPLYGQIPRPDPGLDDWDRGDGVSQGRIVPAECLMDVQTNGQLRQVVSGRCMTAFGISGRMPEACGFEIRTNAGRRMVYGRQCLRDYGYRFENARY